MGVMSHNGKRTQRNSKSVQVIVCTSHVFIPKYYRCIVCVTGVFLTLSHAPLMLMPTCAHCVRIPEHRRNQRLWSPLSTSFARDTQWHNLGWKCTIVFHDGRRLQKFWFVGHHLRLQVCFSVSKMQNASMTYTTPACCSLRSRVCVNYSTKSTCLL